MDLILNVPFNEKEEAKRKGALWNPQIKRWYVKEDPDQDYYENWNYYFKKWLPEHNLLCKNLYLFEMQRECWKCKRKTKVICLATNDAYTLSPGEIFDDKNENLQLLSYVDIIPNKLANYLKENFHYYPSFSKIAKKAYFVNHCEHCKSIKGDNFLHEIPEQAFYKNLCYKNLDKSSYYKILNNYIVPILATLPNYDLVAHSSQMMLLHMESGIENRASLNITQELINTLFENSNFIGNIDINTK